MKIFLFGTGKVADDIIMQINEWPQNIEILGFIDNDSSKWGQNFRGGDLYTRLIDY